MAICESFFSKIWGHGVLWHGTSEQSTKVFSAKKFNGIFRQFVKVFSLESFPLYGMLYMVCINWGSSYYSRNRLKNADSTIFVKVFSLKFGGVVSFGTTWASNSQKFSPLKVSHYTYSRLYMVCINWGCSYYSRNNIKSNIKCRQYIVNTISHCTFSEGGGGPGVVEVNSGRAESLGMGGWGACLRASTDGEGWPLCVRSNATSAGNKNGSQWKDWNHVVSACPGRRVYWKQTVRVSN